MTDKDVEYGIVVEGEPDMEPIPIPAEHRFDQRPGWKIVRRVLWCGPWEEVPGPVDTVR